MHVSASERDDCCVSTLCLYLVYVHIQWEGVGGAIGRLIMGGREVKNSVRSTKAQIHHCFSLPFRNPDYGTVCITPYTDLQRDNSYFTHTHTHNIVHDNTIIMMRIQLEQRSQCRYNI